MWALERNSSSCGFRRGNLLDSTRELNLHGTKLKQEKEKGVKGKRDKNNKKRVFVCYLKRI